MPLFDLVVMGHFSIDFVEKDGKALPPSLGGTVTFSSLAGARLGARVGIVSKVGPDFQDDHLMVFARNGIDISGVKKVEAPTTKYKLHYAGEERKLTLISLCEPIKPMDIKQLRGQVRAVHLGPIAGEIPAETIRKVSEWNVTTLLDLQGVIRKFDKNGEVSVERNQLLPGILKGISIVKASLPEGEIATNTSGLEQVASSFIDMGCRISVITSGGRGSYIYTRDDEKYFIPAITPRKVSDFTGAGDTYAGSFLVEYMRTKDIRRSAIIASSAVSFKVEGHSTSGFASRKEIEERARGYLET